MTEGPSPTAAAEVAGFRPFPPSWLNRLAEGIERLPGPTWIAYTSILAVGIVVMHVGPWSRGTLPVGTFELVSTYWGLLPAALLWVSAYLGRVADDAFEAFRPSLTGSAVDAARLRYELMTVPAVPALAITIGSLVLTAATFAFDPDTSGVTGAPGPVVALLLVVQSFDTAILFQLVYRLLRQMRLVRRTLRQSVTIDLFRPAPLHAFATLTSRPGAALTLLVASSAVIVPFPTDFDSFLVGWAPYLVVPPVIAAIAFVGPLIGVHGRLVAQKEQRRGELETRLKGLLDELNRDVDARDVAQVDGLGRTLAVMLVQRDVLARLPTWPWSMATLRNFVSAILLPLALFLAQRALDQIV